MDYNVWPGLVWSENSLPQNVLIEGKYCPKFRVIVFFGNTRDTNSLGHLFTQA